MLATLSKLVNPHVNVSKQAQQSSNSIPFETSENYKLFESKYTKQSVTLSDGNVWKFYDSKHSAHSDLTDEPLLLIPGTTGCAEVFYQQIVALGVRGYRVISVTIPSVHSVEEFIKSFNRFLNFLGIHCCHLLGCSLGGYLALSFAKRHCERVSSLILTNAFINTAKYQMNASIVPPHYHPTYLLRRYIAGALPTNTRSLQSALSVDFVLKQVGSMSREDLTARLSLNLDRYFLASFEEFDQSKITILDAIDSCMDEEMRDDLYKMLNKSRVCLMKFGGDFPYLSNFEEYTMLCIYHLKRVMSDEHIIVNDEEEEEEELQSVNDIDSKRGMFDHRRLYFDAHKQAIFKDEDENDHKDGVYASDSSQSSDMMDMKYTEADIERRKQHKSGSSNDRIVGIDYPKEQKVENKQRDKLDLYAFDSTQYLITDEKKKMYLMDRKLKKKRYREYLARKKKAYKKYLAQKNGDDALRSMPKKKKRKRRKKRKVHKKKYKDKRRKMIEKIDANKQPLAVADIVQVGSMISPRTFSEDDEVEEVSGVKLQIEASHHDKHASLLEALPIYSIQEESSKLSENDNVDDDVHDDDDESEYKNDALDFVQNKELISQQQQPRVTTVVGGHRYIPSYDSAMNVEDEVESKGDEYYSWSDNRNRADSFLSDLGDYDFVESEIQQWPLEGNDYDHYQPRQSMEIIYNDEEDVGDDIF